MIPDVSKMQVKVGVHESKVGRLRVGMPARVELQDLTLDGEVDSIAEVTRPAGWWTGNMVKYDTLIRLAPQSGLKPGMSAVVDIVLSEQRNVMRIPVAAIVETEEGFLCWVKTPQGAQKRVIELGDSNDEFTVVAAGLSEGDKVVLNPTAFIDEAQLEALRPAVGQGADDSEADIGKAKGLGGVDKTSDDKMSADKSSDDTEENAAENKPATQSVGAKLIAAADKDADGVLTEDEFDEDNRANFTSIDANGDGKVTASELDAAVKAAKGE